MSKKEKDEHYLKSIKESENILITTHKKLCLPILNRIYKKMINGIKFDDIKICEGVIIDGHHRYVSSLLANIKLDEAKSSKTSATIEIMSRYSCSNSRTTIRSYESMIC